MLKERKIPYHAYTTKYYRHATELADQICSKPGKINLVVVGGDGTVNEVLNGMHDFDRVTFGCIPSGSANDFARGFGLAGTPREILERMLDAKEEEYLDFGQVTYGEEGLTRRFIVSSGVGVDADVPTGAGRSHQEGTEPFSSGTAYLCGAHGQDPVYYASDGGGGSRGEWNDLSAEKSDLYCRHEFSL